MDMINWHKMLNDKNITLIYSGPLWSEGIGGIGEALKKRMEFDKMPFNTSQEVFSVFVEQMNNMLMYSAEKIFSESPKGTFILGTLNESKKQTYFIQTGNIMKAENINLVKNKIDYLNTLDKNELRKYYKEQMKIENDNPESKGAGLGFIEIARRISSKIEYAFTQYDEGLTFFTLYVTIGGEDDI
jgi:hypothetical protein